MVRPGGGRDPDGRKPRQRPVEIRAQLCRGASPCAGQRTHDDLTTGRQAVQPFSREMPQLPARAVSLHRRPNRPPDDETDPRPVRPGSAAGLQVVHYQGGAADPPTGSDDPIEVGGPAQSRCCGQHPDTDRASMPVRPTGRRDPCDVGGRSPRGQPGYASATGTRACGRDGDCSAGTCACSRRDLPLRRPTGHAAAQPWGVPGRTRHRWPTATRTPDRCGVREPSTAPRYGFCAAEVNRTLGAAAARCESSTPAVG